MDFKNRLKGSVTQTLVETLLEDVQYRIVPLGIEEVVREVSCLDRGQYMALGLPDTLRKLPDFFIAKKDLSKTWLVEVKYCNKWNDEVKRSLGEQLIEQVKLWSPMHLVLFIGEPARRNDTPASYLAVGKLGVQNEVLGVWHKMYQGAPLISEFSETFIPWSEVTWDSFTRFQDAFYEVSDRREEGTLFKAIEIMRSLAKDGDW